MNFFEEIKSRVTVKNVCDLYGIELNRAGFCCCFLHNEKTPSMKIYDGDRGFHCFGCGATGDVIDFVKSLFGIEFREAVIKINDDFFLGLPINKNLTENEKIAIAKASYERKKKNEAEKAEQQKLEDEYWAAYEEWLKYDEYKRKYAPKDPNEEFHPLYVEALQKIELAKFNLETAEIRRNEYERKKRNRNNS